MLSGKTAPRGIPALYSLECASGGRVASWRRLQAAEGRGPQSLGVRLAEVVLARLRRRVERDRARRAVDVAAHRLAPTSGGKPRRRCWRRDDVTAAR